MTKLETEFTAALLEQIRRAEQETGMEEPRFTTQIQKNGGPAAMKELLRRGQMTRQFEPLREKGRLDLSPEYLVTRGKYGPLFTDEEVDICLAALLEAGAFT